MKHEQSQYKTQLERGFFRHVRAAIKGMDFDALSEITVMELSIELWERYGYPNTDVPSWLERMVNKERRYQLSA